MDSLWHYLSIKIAFYSILIGNKNLFVAGLLTNANLLSQIFYFSGYLISNVRTQTASSKSTNINSAFFSKILKNVFAFLINTAKKGSFDIYVTL